MIKIYSTNGHEEEMITLDKWDVEILRDVLEAHQEYLQDLEDDGMLDDRDELERISGMVDFINNAEIEED